MSIFAIVINLVQGTVWFISSIGYLLMCPARVLIRLVMAMLLGAIICAVVV